MPCGPEPLVSPLGEFQHLNVYQTTELSKKWISILISGVEINNLGWGREEGVVGTQKANSASEASVLRLLPPASLNCLGDQVQISYFHTTSFLATCFEVSA